jgi:hypothetical protein
MASLKSLSFQPSCSATFMDKGYSSFWGEDASTKAFADKIARKLQWRHRFALRAIREYKKFICLGPSVIL